jgi:GT2 family glycosyltransferase
MISLPKDEYRLVKNASEDIESLKKAISKSDIIFEMNFDSGNFKGKHGQINFNGKYTIKKVNSGFTKGFNYEVELESLQSDATNTKSEEKFIQSLASCTSIFIAPNRLYQPTHTQMDIKGENQKISLYLIN